MHYFYRLIHHTSRGEWGLVRQRNFWMTGFVLLITVLSATTFHITVSAQDTDSCERPAAITKSGRDALVAGLTKLVEVSAACQSDGDWEAYSRLTTENFLGQVYGGGGLLSREDFLALTG